jgi:glucose dehydrogenase
VAASIASSSGQATKAITPSPVFTAQELSKPAGNDWHSYYGALTGQRYSSLKQITTGNVSQLKELWHISLGSCTAGLIAGDPVIPGVARGTAGNPTNCGSMESNPVAIDGVLYTTNAPLGAVWALDAKSGSTIWKYTPSFAGEVLNSGAPFTPGSGGRRAGVAVGEGKVFNGLPDGRLVALEQTSGKQLWEAFVGSYKVNAKISTAPIYVNGMVIVGDG